MNLIDFNDEVIIDDEIDFLKKENRFRYSIPVVSINKSMK